MIKNRSLLLVLMMVSSSCSSVTYRVTDIDRDTTISYQSVITRNCLSSTSIEWGSGIPIGLQPSHRYSGEEVSYVRVDLRRVIDAAKEQLLGLQEQLCSPENKLLFEVTKLVHKHDIAPETGVTYVSAGMKLSANGTCGNNGRIFSGTFTADSKSIKVGFAASTSNIERALIRATTYASIEVLSKVIQECAANRK